MKKRIDQLLVDQGLAPSKTKAQEMLQRGEVRIKYKKTPKKTSTKNPVQEFAKIKPSKLFAAEEIDIQIAGENLLQFVSRAGFKLAGALKHTALNVANFNVLDVGQSTGGFTDCLLQYGAKHVVGLDVAQDELAPQLRQDKRVTAITGINARDLSSITKQLHALGPFNLIVVDVSFIGVEKIWPEVLKFLCPGGYLLSLIKPQFQLGAKALNKKGVVSDSQLFAGLQDQLYKVAEQQGLTVLDYFASQVKGRTGNQEFFIYAKK